jgi:hypothetical protein
MGVDVVVDDAECAAQGKWSGWPVGGEEGSQEPAVDLGVEEGDSDTFRRQHVGIGLR